MSVVDVRSVPQAADASGSVLPSESGTLAYERPQPIRRDTDQILSYYQSEDAGRAYVSPVKERISYASTSTSTPRRAPSPGSRSSSPSSTYSNPISSSYSDSSPITNGDGALAFPPGTASLLAFPPGSPPPASSSSFSAASASPTAPALSPQPRRRTSTRSTGGSDKRRVAIVEMDSAVLDAINNNHVGHGLNSRQASGSSSYYSDSGHGSSPSSSASALLTRRGLEGYRIPASLAFVAPPDASPSAYTNLTPPLSAPPQHQKLPRDDSLKSSVGHQRSHSEAVKPGHPNRLRKSSRDIGIVGTSVSVSPTTGQTKMDLKFDETRTRMDNVKSSPIFQRPSLSEASLSPAEEPRSSDTQEHIMTSKDAKQYIQLTNGHSSRNRDSDISPVIVGLTANQMWQSPSIGSVAYSGYAPVGQPTSVVISTAQYVAAPQAVQSAYLYYQPGVHATAGPLPPPPRQVLPPSSGSMPPPRPPRMERDRKSRQEEESPGKAPSQITKKTSSASIKRPHSPSATSSSLPATSNDCVSPSTTMPTLDEVHGDEPLRGGHKREGAFPTTSVFITNATPPRGSDKETRVLRHKSTMDALVEDVSNAIENAELNHGHEVDPLVSDDPRLARRRSGVDLHRESSRSTFKGEEPPLQSPNSDYSDNPLESTKPLPDPFIHPPPSSYPASNDQRNKRTPSPQKQLIDYAMKRFSALPRTPSYLSVSKQSQRSSLSQEQVSPQPRVATLTKIRSTWPDAMNFGDVLAKKSCLERSRRYAEKINELANYDSGLGDWVVMTKRNLTKSRTATARRSVSPMSPRGPSDRAFTGQKRHVSRGSIGSEMTFPKRIDAYVATDLSWRPSEDSSLPEGPPPSLPYPSLAQAPPRVATTKSFGGLSSASSMRSVPSTPSSSKSSGGFFASIGRKTSIKRERSATSNAPSAKLLSKKQQSIPNPRPIQIGAAPSLPGGPRAPPGRVQRAQSVIGSSRAMSIAPTHYETESDTGHGPSIRRSPSVAPSVAQSTATSTADSISNFDRQLKKLADLLPHADRDILAGYLRRCGSDITAIGQYLEDEKNGCLRRIHT